MCSLDGDASVALFPLSLATLSREGREEREGDYKDQGDAHWLRRHCTTLRSVRLEVPYRSFPPWKTKVRIQYDHRRQVMAISRAWEGPKQTEAISLCAMPQGFYGVDWNSCAIQTCTELFTLPPVNLEWYGSENMDPCFASKDMAFAHVGEDGWFLLVPSKFYGGLVVYNLVTRSCYVYRPDNMYRTRMIVAAYGDLVVVSFAPSASIYFSAAGPMYCKAVVLRLHADGALTEECDINFGRVVHFMSALFFSKDGKYLAVVCTFGIFEDQVVVFRTHDWVEVNEFMWPLDAGRITSVLDFDDTRAIVLTGKTMAYLSNGDTKLEIEPWQCIFPEEFGTPPVYGGVFVPGLGIFCGHGENGFVGAVDGNSAAMFFMSPIRVAWMVGVYRGCVKRERVRWA